MIDCGKTFSHFKLGMRKKGCDKAFDYHIVELGLGIGEFHYASSRDDRKVIGYFTVIENALVKANSVLFERFFCPIRRCMIGIG